MTACATREDAVTVPRPVFGVCLETPCRVRLQAVRGKVPSGEKRPAGMILELRDFFRTHPRQAAYRFGRKPSPLRPGSLEAILRIAPDQDLRVRLAPEAAIELPSLHFPQVPGPLESTVFRAVRPENRGNFRCAQDADTGTVFSVPWVHAGKPAHARRKNNPAPGWPPLRILHTTGRLIVLSHVPERERALWMALADCLGPVAVAQPEPGEIADAQVSGISLWQWLEPAGPSWRALNEKLRARGPLVAAVVQNGRAVRMFETPNPVDFLEIMAREHILAPDAVWAAWTRLLQAGVPAARFARLRPHLLESPREGEDRHADRP